MLQQLVDGACRDQLENVNSWDIVI